jgi:hypothetical protein
MKFIAPIEPKGKFALLDPMHLKGGFKQVATFDVLSSLDSFNIPEGTFVYVQDLDRLYRLKNGKWGYCKFDENKNYEIYAFNTIVTKIEMIDDFYKISLAENHFQANDIIGWNINFDLTEFHGSYAKIWYSNKEENYIYIRLDDDYAPTLPELHKEIYMIGNVELESRQRCMVSQVVDAKTTFTLYRNISLEKLWTEKNIVVGDPSQGGILVSDYVHLTGTFIDKDGNDLSELSKENNEILNTSIETMRQEFDYDNLLNNAMFTDKLEYWYTVNSAGIFTNKKGQFIQFHKTLLTTKPLGAIVTSINSRKYLFIRQGFVKQTNSNMKIFLSMDELEKPFYVTLVFSLKPLTAGTITVAMEGETSDYYMDRNIIVQPTKFYKTFTEDDLNKNYVVKQDFLWNYTGDLKISYTGEIQINTLVLKFNTNKTL